MKTTATAQTKFIGYTPAPSLEEALRVVRHTFDQAIDVLLDENPDGIFDPPASVPVKNYGAFVYGLRKGLTPTFLNDEAHGQMPDDARSAQWAGRAQARSHKELAAWQMRRLITDRATARWVARKEAQAEAASNERTPV